MKAIHPLSARLLATFVAFAALSLDGVAATASSCPPDFGDVTEDAHVNIVDVQCSILSALWAIGGGTPPACAPTSPMRADLSCDGNVTVADVQLMIVRVLGSAFDPQVDANQNQCPDACEAAECGDGTCQVAIGETCASCAADCGTCAGESCCTDLSGSSCLDASCAACVCALDPYCCSAEWDAVCAETAQIECTSACGCAPLAKGPCCSANEAPGCEDAACETCGCDLDPFCCEVAWDGMCVGWGLGPCALDCMCGGVEAPQ